MNLKQTLPSNAADISATERQRLRNNLLKAFGLPVENPDKVVVTPRCLGTQMSECCADIDNCEKNYEIMENDHNADTSQFGDLDSCALNESGELTNKDDCIKYHKEALNLELDFFGVKVHNDINQKTKEKAIDVITDYKLMKLDLLACSAAVDNDDERSVECSLADESIQVIEDKLKEMGSNVDIPTISLYTDTE
jgi:hypothetical protein